MQFYGPAHHQGKTGILAPLAPIWVFKVRVSYRHREVVDLARMVQLIHCGAWIWTQPGFIMWFFNTGLYSLCKCRIWWLQQGWQGKEDSAPKRGGWGFSSVEGRLPGPEFGPQHRGKKKKKTKKIKTKTRQQHPNEAASDRQSQVRRAWLNPSLTHLLCLSSIDLIHVFHQSAPAAVRCSCVLHMPA
jgi:hypothetical protein